MKMKKLLKNIAPEFKVSIALFFISLALLIGFDKNIFKILTDNLDMIIEILYLTCFAVAISTVIHFLLPVEFVQQYLMENKVSHLFYASLLGVLTPGPVYAVYPILLVLKKKGVGNAMLVSYITGQTIIGPARIPFEVGLFGLDFFLYRIALSLLMAPMAGMLYILFTKFLPDED
jgi:uncharacterized membrane protein YraQ (UPF0718 family)